MKLAIFIHTDSAAFFDNSDEDKSYSSPNAELARILRDLAKKLETGNTLELNDADTIYDINNNTAGNWRFD